MFKNLVLYRLQAGSLPGLQALDAALQRAPFQPCGATQPLSLGWVPPRGRAHGPLVESVGGQWLLALMVERRLLPASVVRRRTDELSAKIEQETGRKPGRRQAKELKEQVLLELLPRAFTKQSVSRAWIDPRRGLLMVDAAGAARADELVAQLVKGLDGLAVAPLDTALAAAAAMAGWLASGEPPAGFTVDRECELKSEDAMKSVVRYARHALDTDEVRQHVALGKRPTRLALTWRGRVSFVLADSGQLRRLDFLDGVFEGRPERAEGDDGFDADAAIATGELVQLIPDLVDALGGEQRPGATAPEAPAPRLAA